MNRVQACITIIEANTKNLDKKAYKIANQGATLDFKDHFTLQDAQALLRAEEKISLEEAITLYEILGHTAGQFNKQPLAKRIAVLAFFAHIGKQNENLVHL